MKKKTLLILSFCAILIAAFREGGRRETDDNAAIGIAYFISAALDFSDLDVRDALDSPIKSPSAAQELATLFRENLIDLTVFANIHPMAETITWIYVISHLFNGMFLSRLTMDYRAIPEAIFISIKRFVHNVDNLWITFSDGVLLRSLLPLTCHLSRTPLNIPLLR